LLTQLIKVTLPSIEDIHKSIASLPLEILAKVAPFADSAKGVKEVQGDTINKLYDMIRTVNQKISELAETYLQKKEKQGKAPEKSMPKIA